jgi:CysZ protein
MEQNVFATSQQIVRALAATFGAFKERFFWRILLLSGVLNTLLLGAVYYYTSDYLSENDFSLMGLEQVVRWMGPWLAGFLTLLLLPLTLPLTSLLFLDSAITATEKKHYPERQSATVPAFRALESSAGLMVVALLLNMLLVPLYFIPFLNLLLYFGLNGYLLGREYFEMVAIRHLEKEELRMARRSQWLRLWTSGMLITLTFMIPVINLLAPVLATVFMAHLFHRTSVAS